MSSSFSFKHLDLSGILREHPVYRHLVDASLLPMCLSHVDLSTQMQMLVNVVDAYAFRGSPIAFFIRSYVVCVTFFDLSLFK